MITTTQFSEKNNTKPLPNHNADIVSNVAVKSPFPTEVLYQALTEHIGKCTHSIYQFVGINNYCMNIIKSYISTSNDAPQSLYSNVVISSKLFKLFSVPLLLQLF